MTLQDIRDLLRNAKLGRAINAAAELPSVINDTDYSTMITMFLSRYNSNKKNKMIGIIDDDDFRKEEAQLTHGLLSLLSDLNDQDASPTGDAPTPVPAQAPKPQVPAPDTAADDGITKILFLASNPSDTAKLQLTTEHSRVSARLQEALEPEKFPLKFRQAVTPSEFAEYLFLEKPDIVHFSGHGDRKAPEVQSMIRESRAGRTETTTTAAKQEEESGIFLLDEDKRHAHFVNTTFLKRTFKSIVQRQKIPIKVVVFNACHSSQQAEAISQIVPYVVGTSWSVGDQAATAFASGFYFGIAQGMDIEGAVDFGINQALAFNEPEDRFLLYKDGVKVEW